MTTITERIQAFLAPEPQTSDPAPRPWGGSFPLPWGLGNANAPLAAGATATGAFVIQFYATPTVIKPLGDYLVPDTRGRPRRSISITRLYLPGCLTATQATAPFPTKARVQLALWLYGYPAWASENQFDLTQQDPSTFAAGFTVTEDLVNPIALGATDQLELRYGLSFDKAVSASNVWAAAQLTGANSLSQAPGAAYYQVQD